MTTTIPRGPAADDPRYRAVLAARADRARASALGTAAWSPEAEPAVSLGGRRVPELVVGFLLALEVYPVSLGGVAAPVNELAMLVLLALALCRRSTRDTSALGVTALLAGVVVLSLAGVSLAHGIPDAAWLRRLVRIVALAALVGCIAGRRLDLRSVLLGLLTAMAVNVPLFYAGLVPAPYQQYLTGFLGDKNVAGLYYAAMPVLALMTVRSPKVRLAVLAAAGVCVVLTGSRTSMAAFGCALVWLMMSPRLGPVLRVGPAVALAWAVSFSERNLARIGGFADRVGTDWLREQIQSASAAKTAATPWTGRGLTEAHVVIGEDTWLYHDSYAGLYTEGGVLFLGGVLLAYAVYGLRLGSRRLRTPSRVAVEAAGIVVLVAATQLGEVFVTIPSMLVLAAGVSLALDERGAPLEEQVAERERRHVVEQAARRWG